MPRTACSQTPSTAPLLTPSRPSPLAGLVTLCAAPLRFEPARTRTCAHARAHVSLPRPGDGAADERGAEAMMTRSSPSQARRAMTAQLLANTERHSHSHTHCTAPARTPSNLLCPTTHRRVARAWPNDVFNPKDAIFAYLSAHCTPSHRPPSPTPLPYPIYHSDHAHTPSPLQLAATMISATTFPRGARCTNPHTPRTTHHTPARPHPMHTTDTLRICVSVSARAAPSARQCSTRSACTRSSRCVPPPPPNSSVHHRPRTPPPTLADRLFAAPDIVVDDFF